MYIELLIDWLAGWSLIYSSCICISISSIKQIKKINRNLGTSGYAKSTWQGRFLPCQAGLDSFLDYLKTVVWLVNRLTFCHIHRYILIIQPYIYVYIGIYKQWIVGEDVEQVFTWVCLKIVVYPIVPNGFADHYPVFKWLQLIGNINPTFSDKPIYVPLNPMVNDHYPY